MNRKGISAVIATLLLMVLAVASSVVVYSYTMGWLGGTTGNPGGQLGALSLDSVTCDATADTITAYVRNIGGLDVSITHIYVNGTDMSYVGPTLIAMGSVVTITEDTGNTYTAGTTYAVKFVAQDGTSLSFSVKAVA